MTELVDSEEENQESMSPVKTGLIVGGIVLAAVAVGVFVMYILGDESDASMFSSNPLDDDRAEIETAVSDFLVDAGTFGVDEDEYSANDFHTIYQQWRNSQSVDGMYEDVFETRDEAYLRMREDHIVRDSPLWYDEESIQEWDIMDDVYQHRSFAVDPESISYLYVEQVYDPEDDASEAEGGVIGSDYRLAEVTVEWTSAERVREEMSRRGQSDWNGSVRILQRDYADTTATITVAEVGDEWRIYNHDVNQPHLLSTWDNIRNISVDGDFMESGTMTPSPQLRTLTDIGDGEYEDADGNIVQEDEVRPGEHIVSQGFYNYCSEDMPDQYGNPEDDGYREVRDGDDCMWILDEEQNYHPDESVMGADD